MMTKLRFWRGKPKVDGVIIEYLSELRKEEELLVN
jgi:hypothetical protein